MTTKNNLKLLIAPSPSFPSVASFGPLDNTLERKDFSPSFASPLPNLAEGFSPSEGSPPSDYIRMFRTPSAQLASPSIGIANKRPASQGGFVQDEEDEPCASSVEPLSSPTETDLLFDLKKRIACSPTSSSVDTWRWSKLDENKVDPNLVGNINVPGKVYPCPNYITQEWVDRMTDEYGNFLPTVERYREQFKFAFQIGGIKSILAEGCMGHSLLHHAMKFHLNDCLEMVEQFRKSQALPPKGDSDFEMIGYDEKVLSCGAGYVM